MMVFVDITQIKTVSRDNKNVLAIPDGNPQHTLLIEERIWFGTFFHDPINGYAPDGCKVLTGSFSLKSPLFPIGHFLV